MAPHLDLEAILPIKIQLIGPIYSFDISYFKPILRQTATIFYFSSGKTETEIVQQRQSDPWVNTISNIRRLRWDIFKSSSTLKYCDRTLASVSIVYLYKQTTYPWKKSRILTTDVVCKNRLDILMDFWLNYVCFFINLLLLRVQVFRHDSRKLPIGDPDVDWEETIYLNLIVHQLEYTITLAICSRTSPKDLQVRGLMHNLAAF